MSSLLQTKEWATLRQAQGWQAYWVDDVLILQRNLFLGKSFLYAPEVAWRKLSQSQVIASLAKQSNKEGIAASSATPRNDNIIFFRLEILDENQPEIMAKLKQNGFIKSFEEVQPEWRQIIDISPSEEEILAQMREKGRYNIRVAQKHGVIIEKSENIDEFYQIFCQTARRDGFQIRPKQYFENMMQILAPKNYAELLVARYNNKTIAAEIVTYYNETASYLYGASSNEQRNLMAPYLLHWEAIRRAKEKGCQYYDLLAVAPEGIEKHKYAGISRFKRQFGGRTVQIVGSYDLVFQPFWYRVFKMGEKIRRK